MDISKLNILVTGGTGFIGSHIVQYLLENGAKSVRILDNLSTGKLENVQDLLDKYDNFDFFLGDIQDYNNCLKMTKNIDIICHQAAYTSVPRSIVNPLDFHTTNVTGFLNLLNAAKCNGVKRFVYASSSSVYGDNSDDIKQEDSIGIQMSPYALTKYIDELYAKLYTNLYGMECIG